MMARLSWYLDPLFPHQLKMFKFGPPMTKRSVSARVKDCAILEPYVQTDESPLEFNPQCKIRIRERSDLMVECLTRDRRVTGLMIREEPCHNRGGTVDNLGDPG